MFAKDHTPFGFFDSNERNEFSGRLRAGRGMMEPAILQVLLTKPMHGYEIISTLEAHSHGMWRPSAGSVYPTLQLLEEKDYLTSSEQDGKKVYTLTVAGKTAAKQAAQQYEAAWQDRMEAFRGMHDYRREFGDAMRLMRSIIRKGTDQQKSQLIAEINTFTAALRRITEEGC